jgi:hypothetical protein
MMAQRFGFTENFLQSGIQAVFRSFRKFSVNSKIKTGLVIVVRHPG